MPKSLNYGFIGAGQIAHYAAKAVNSHPDSRVVAVQDLSAERRDDLCQAFDIPSAHAEASELFANPDVDAVYIAVPNKFHAPLAIEALEAGKHVLLEKPFAMNFTEAKAVANAAAATGKALMIGMNLRFSENHQKIRTLAEAGIFGEIYYARAYWYRRSGIPKLGTWFGNRQFSGGGCLLDIGVHLLDLCMYCIDNFDARSVSGLSFTKFGNRGMGEGGWGLSDRAESAFDVEDFATAQIRMHNGACLNLDVSWACHRETGNALDVEICGTDAGATVSDAKVFRNDPLRTEYDVIDQVRAEIRYPHQCRFANFTNHLVHNESLCVTVEQALAVQQILDAIAKSSEAGHEIQLDRIQSATPSETSIAA